MNTTRRATQQMYVLSMTTQVQQTLVHQQDDGTLVATAQPVSMVRVCPSPIRGIEPFLLPATGANPFEGAAARLVADYGIAGHRICLLRG